MKKSFFFSLLIVSLLLPFHLHSASQTPVAQGSLSSVSAGLRSLKPAEAKMIMDNRADVLVIDVRTPGELKEGKVQDSQLVPFMSIMRNQHNLPKNKAIFLICAVGGRSYAAGKMLVHQGYNEVYNISGGMSAWKQAGLPVVF